MHYIISAHTHFYCKLTEIVHFFIYVDLSGYTSFEVCFLGDFYVWFADVIVGGGAVNQNICVLFSSLVIMKLLNLRQHFQFYSLPSYYLSQN